MPSIVIELRDGNTVVKRFTRHSSREIAPVIQDAMGWLQSYGCQVSAEQWANDVKHAESSAS
jgi:hypothetical protein